MAVAVSLEPFRIGMTLLMLNRPRPLLQLLAFLAGGFSMGITVGVVVLFVLRPALGSTHLTLPKMQVAVGALALVTAAAVATGIVGGGHGGVLAARTRQLIDGGSLWTAGLAGLGIALPSVDYLAALALILVSGAAAATQFGALMLYNLVAFALVEIPLVAYLVAPERTHATLSALHDWLRSRRRHQVAALLAAIGCVLLGVGFAGL